MGDIDANQLIVYYSGTIWSPQEYIFELSPPNQTGYFRYQATRNLMSHRSSYFLLNVLEEYWSLSKFRSTLGHKVNHSFTKANAIFISVIHPRHGPIKAAISTRKIMKGQEILCNYGYDPNGYVPSWYAKLYK